MDGSASTAGEDVGVVCVGGAEGSNCASTPDAAAAGDVLDDGDVVLSDGGADAAVLPDEVGYARVEEAGGCNGPVALCERPYDEVVYATTHNAMSNPDDDFFGPNQGQSVARQLAGGVRALMLDVHDDEGVTSLCHGLCLAGRRPLVDGLAEIEAFMRDNPREVVTIIFENYVSAEALEEAFEGSGLMAHVHRRGGDQWPTLEAMIDGGQRLVVLTDRGGGVFDWLIDVWEVAWETPFSARGPEDFSCEPNRGDVGHSLFIFNHFLTDPIGRVDLAERVNHNPLLLERARRCQEERQQLPNFITVDFYEVGDTLEVVDILNGVAAE